MEALLSSLTLTEKKQTVELRCVALVVSDLSVRLRHPSGVWVAVVTEECLSTMKPEDYTREKLRLGTNWDWWIPTLTRAQELERRDYQSLYTCAQHLARGLRDDDATFVTVTAIKILCD